MHGDAFVMNTRTKGRSWDNGTEVVVVKYKRMHIVHKGKIK
jgi:hypothetical protein